MGVTWSGNKIYFDELSKGISSGVIFDNSAKFDSEDLSVIRPKFDFVGVEKYIASETRTISMKMSFEGNENYSKFVDLLLLVPEKFRSSLALQQFLDEAGLNVGEWIGLIKDLEELLDKYSVGEDYIQYLADLIGLKLSPTLAIDQKRQQLIQAIDWYKMKGTYQALQYVAYSLGLNLNFWDMYCDSSVHYNSGIFSKQAWYAGDLGTNPSGLGVGYFKTPHFGIDIVLDTEYTDDTPHYLWHEDLYTPMLDQVESVRPVNTVPHFTLSLNPVTYDNSAVYTISGNIRTCVVGNWSYILQHFDQPTPLSFDNGEVFDYSEGGLISSILKWKLGTGSKGVPPAPSGFSLETPVLSGNVNLIETFDDRVVYTITLDEAVVQSGLSELGLYLTDGTTLEVAATFPDIDKHVGPQLEIQVTIMYSAESSSSSSSSSLSSSSSCRSSSSSSRSSSSSCLSSSSSSSCRSSSSSSCLSSSSSSCLSSSSSSSHSSSSLSSSSSCRSSSSSSSCISSSSSCRSSSSSSSLSSSCSSSSTA